MAVTILLLMLLSFLGVVAAIYSRPCVVCPWKDKEVQGGTNRSQQKTQQDENDQSASPLALVCPLLYPTPPVPSCTFSPHKVWHRARRRRRTRAPRRRGLRVLVFLPCGGGWRRRR